MDKQRRACVGNKKNMPKKVPCEEGSVDKNNTSQKEITFPLEVWFMIMEFMDYQTLYSMTQVSMGKKILAEEKIKKLKSKVEGTFINISEVEHIEDVFWTQPHVMKTLVIGKEGKDFVCNVFNAIIVDLRVLQQTQVAAIKLCPVVNSPPDLFDENEVDQSMKVSCNVTMLDLNTYKLEMVWSEEQKMTLYLNKGDGTLRQIVESIDKLDEVMFMEVPSPWQYLVRNTDGLVARLHVTNIKLRTSRRKGVKLNQKQLISRVLAHPQAYHPVSLPLDHFEDIEFAPFPGPLEVGQVQVQVLSTGLIGGQNINEIDIDHMDIIRSIFHSDVPAGGVVMNVGLEFFGFQHVNADEDEGATVDVTYKVVKTTPSPACLVVRVEQVTVVENAAG